MEAELLAIRVRLETRGRRGTLNIPEGLRRGGGGAPGYMARLEIHRRRGTLGTPEKGFAEVVVELLATRFGSKRVAGMAFSAFLRGCAEKVAGLLNLIVFSAPARNKWQAWFSLHSWRATLRWWRNSWLYGSRSKLVAGVALSVFLGSCAEVEAELLAVLLRLEIRRRRGTLGTPDGAAHKWWQSS